MTPKEFILTKLEKISQTKETYNFTTKNEVQDFIFSILMSKKFRKFSVLEEYTNHIKRVIKESVEENKPIKLSFPFGGYKLWRLKETPEVDWAELFTLMYYAKWLTPICKVHIPGIIFDFSSDDMIVERMNNISKTETQAYKESFVNLVTFLEKYIPNNLKFTFTPISSFYSEKEFEIDLQDKIEKKKEEFGGLPKLDDKKKKMVELNVHLLPGQDDDLLWREKIELIHQAYYAVDKRRPYNRAPDKILVFCGKLSDGKVISVGTTKSSIAKFWVGVGALKRIDDSYKEYVLSPSQIEDTIAEEDILIEELKGKNFNSIKTFS